MSKRIIPRIMGSLAIDAPKARIIASAIWAGLFLTVILLCSWLTSSTGLSTNLGDRNLSPSLQHLFGTDWLGRDMFTRSVKGLSLSLQVGIAGALCSTVIATLMGLLAATMGKTADRLVSWLIDAFLSVPHLVTLILIAFVVGGGMKGIVIGIMLTHWPSLARLIRAEALQLMTSDYVQISRKLGRSRWWVAAAHLIPHIAPQIAVGFLLLFPHAILHEAAVTFLGLGLSPHTPAIGIILSESMRYLSTGMWWLALFPGLVLLVAVRSFERLGAFVKLLSGRT
jgi:peptide/nickel transport system permease protein